MTELKDILDSWLKGKVVSIEANHLRELIDFLISKNLNHVLDLRSFYASGTTVVTRLANQQLARFLVQLEMHHWLAFTQLNPANGTLVVPEFRVVGVDDFIVSKQKCPALTTGVLQDSYQKILESMQILFNFTRTNEH